MAYIYIYYIYTCLYVDETRNHYIGLYIPMVYIYIYYIYTCLFADETRNHYIGYNHYNH